MCVWNRPDNKITAWKTRWQNYMTHVHKPLGWFIAAVTLWEVGPKFWLNSVIFMYNIFTSQDGHFVRLANIRSYILVVTHLIDLAYSTDHYLDLASFTIRMTYSGDLEGGAVPPALKTSLLFTAVCRRALCYLMGKHQRTEGGKHVRVGALSGWYNVVWSQNKSAISVLLCSLHSGAELSNLCSC